MRTQGHERMMENWMLDSTNMIKLATSIDKHENIFTGKFLASSIIVHDYIKKKNARYIHVAENLVYVTSRGVKWPNDFLSLNKVF